MPFVPYVFRLELKIRYRMLHKTGSAANFPEIN
jgi:hypothetical protein